MHQVHDRTSQSPVDRAGSLLKIIHLDLTLNQVMNVRGCGGGNMPAAGPSATEPQAAGSYNRVLSCPGGGNTAVRHCAAAQYERRPHAACHPPRGRCRGAQQGKHTDKAGYKIQRCQGEGCSKEEEHGPPTLCYRSSEHTSFAGQEHRMRDTGEPAQKQALNKAGHIRGRSKTTRLQVQQAVEQGAAGMSAERTIAESGAGGSAVAGQTHGQRQRRQRRRRRRTP